MYSPRLRILVDPVYIQAASLGGSSTYHKCTSLVRELVKRGHYVYWCVPDRDNYVPAEIEDHPNVGIIRVEYIQDQFVADGLVTDKFFNLFNRVGGKYHVDAVVTGRTGMALNYKRMLEPPRFHDNDGNYTDKGYGMPVCVLEEFPQTPTRQNTGKAYWLSQCLGYIAAERTFFLSDHNREEVVKDMTTYITTSQVRKWLGNTRIIPSGIHTAELDEIYDPDRWKVERGFNVLSVGWLMGVSYVHYLPWFDYFFKAGIDDAKLTLSLGGTLSGPMRSKLSKIGFDFNGVGRNFEIIENNPRSNFLRMVRKFHCFVAPVSHLDYPTGILECMYLGLPGILPVSDYQQTFFKDYPFVVNPKKHEEFLAQLQWIRENPEEARAMVLPWREVIREQHDAGTSIAWMADEVEEAARSHINRFKTSGAVIKFCQELKGKSYTWADIVAYLRKSGFMGVSIGDMSIRTTFTYARGAIHHTMRKVGYVDVCDGPVEKFVRKDVFEREWAGRLPADRAPEVPSGPAEADAVEDAPGERVGDAAPAPKRKGGIGKRPVKRAKG